MVNGKVRLRVEGENEGGSKLRGFGDFHNKSSSLTVSP